MKSLDITASIQDLIVHLHRSNGARAETIAELIAGHLKANLLAGPDDGSPDRHRAQQTMFAMDEVRLLLAERDFGGATAAARDAVKEWKSQPVPRASA